MTETDIRGGGSTLCLVLGSGYILLYLKAKKLEHLKYSSYCI